MKLRMMRWKDAVVFTKDAVVFAKDAVDLYKRCGDV